MGNIITEEAGSEWSLPEAQARRLTGAWAAGLRSGPGRGSNEHLQRPESLRAASAQVAHTDFLCVASGRRSRSGACSFRALAATTQEPW